MKPGCILDLNSPKVHHRSAGSAPSDSPCFTNLSTIWGGIYVILRINWSIQGFNSNIDYTRKIMIFFRNLWALAPPVWFPAISTSLFWLLCLLFVSSNQRGCIYLCPQIYKRGLLPVVQASPTVPAKAYWIFHRSYCWHNYQHCRPANLLSTILSSWGTWMPILVVRVALSPLQLSMSKEGFCCDTSHELHSGFTLL